MRKVLFALLLLLSTTALAGPPRAEIEELNRQMTAALERGDASFVAHLYLDDAAIVGPRGRAVRGREAIDAYWARIPKPKWQLVVREVGGSSDDAYEIGQSTLSYKEGDNDHSYTCDFVLIWRRVGGKLRIHLDFYN